MKNLSVFYFKILKETKVINEALGESTPISGSVKIDVFSGGNV